MMPGSGCPKAWACGPPQRPWASWVASMWLPVGPLEGVISEVGLRAQAASGATRATCHCHAGEVDFLSWRHTDAFRAAEHRDEARVL